MQMGNPKEVGLPRAIAHESKPSSNPNTSKLCLSRHQHWQVQGSAHPTGHSVLAVVSRWLGWGAILPTQEDICKKEIIITKNQLLLKYPACLCGSSVLKLTLQTNFMFNFNVLPCNSQRSSSPFAVLLHFVVSYRKLNPKSQS